MMDFFILRTDKVHSFDRSVVKERTILEHFLLCRSRGRLLRVHDLPLRRHWSLQPI